MSPLGLSDHDRDEFRRICSHLGSKDQGVLIESLADEVWRSRQRKPPADVVNFLGLVDEGLLRRAGEMEVGLWLRIVPRYKRNKIKAAFLPIVGVVRKTSELFMQKNLLSSFPNALQVPMDDRVEITLRAGLHHVARCLADCKPAFLRPALHGLNPAWAQCLMLFHGDLAGLKSCRDSASRMRRYWLRGSQ